MKTKETTIDVINRLANMLNGREYHDETSPEILKYAQDNSLCFIYGYSDDNVILNGSIKDEVGAWGGTEFYLGIGYQSILTGYNLEEIEGRLDREDWKWIKPLIEKEKKGKPKVIAKYSHEGYTFHISLEGSQPYGVFDILEDGEKYCRGIVISTEEFINEGNNE